jgi:peptide/nickel transport system ATP-binding protein
MTSTPGPRSTITSLESVPGNLPDLRRSQLPACRFAERCERADERCRSQRPPLAAQAGEQHAVACWYPMHHERPPRPDAAAAPRAEPQHV